MRHPLLLTMFAALACGVSAKAAGTEPGAPEAESSQRRLPEIRFLCVADELPLRYVKAPGGREVPVFAGFDEEPPNTFFVKRDGAYKPGPLPRNVVSKAHRDLRGKAGKNEGYFIKTFEAQDFASSWAKSAAVIAATQKGGAGAPPPPVAPDSKAEKTEWAPLAAPPPQDGKDYLVCLYQPSTKVKWYPPKIRYVDISPKTLPAGSVLVANFSDREVHVRLGGAAPLKLPVDGQVVVPMPGGAGVPVPVAVAAMSRDGTVMQMMAPPRQRVLPAGHAGVIGLYSLYERTSDKPVGIRFTSYEVPPPLAKP